MLGYFGYFFFDGGFFVCQDRADLTQQQLHFFHDDDFKELFLAAEVIVQQCQVNARFFGNIACTRSSITFLSKYLAGGFLDFFLGAQIARNVLLLCHASLLYAAKLKRNFGLTKYFNRLINIVGKYAAPATLRAVSNYSAGCNSCPHKRAAEQDTK